MSCISGTVMDIDIPADECYFPGCEAVFVFEGA